MSTLGIYAARSRSQIQYVMIATCRNSKSVTSSFPWGHQVPASVQGVCTTRQNGSDVLNHNLNYIGKCHIFQEEYGLVSWYAIIDLPCYALIFDTDKLYILRSNKWASVLLIYCSLLAKYQSIFKSTNYGIFITRSVKLHTFYLNVSIINHIQFIVQDKGYFKALEKKHKYL